MQLTTLQIKNEVKGTHIGTVSNVDGNCALNSNDGTNVEVACNTNMFSNNIAFISASNPLFGSAKFELRDPKNNEVLSTCDSSGECEIAKPINVQNTSSDYLVSKDILYMVKMLYQSKILISKIFKLS
ncbi:hypothetical protein [Francisella hispaniensis]|nr:hypothetical protein [Francisella hispaniensis]